MAGQQPQIGQAPSKDKLKSLEKELRQDTVADSTTRDSQLLNGASAPEMLFSHGNARDAEKKMFENIYLKPQTQFHYEPNLLGDYSGLMQQMDGQLNSIADSYVLSTIESRRPPSKLADTTTDGYSILANTFGLHERSAKIQKKEGKTHRLSQQSVMG